MRCIEFSLGERQYVLPLTDLVEVLPMLAMHTLPKAPDYIGGLINYRGQAVPVVDMCQLVNRRPCQARMSSRMLLVRISAGLLALLVERATDIVDLDPVAFAPAPVHVLETPYLDSVAVHAPGMPQLLRVSCLLPDVVLDLLYPNGHGVLDNKTCHARSPLPTPPPQAGEGEIESLREFQVNGAA